MHTKKSMHYWDDELHEYLQGAANTYTFTVNAKHPDAEHVTVGNKVSFTSKGKSYYLNIVNTDQTEQTITATAWSLSFELINEDAGEYKAGKAMSFEEYLAVFDAERTLKLGLNEVSDKRMYQKMDRYNNRVKEIILSGKCLFRGVSSLRRAHKSITP